MMDCKGITPTVHRIDDSCGALGLRDEFIGVRMNLPRACIVRSG
jgi:hypothetical protein